MNGKKQQEEFLIKNLQDAGCSQDILEQFMENHKTSNTIEQISILSEHRSTVLNSVHKEQTKLDCLDYLLFKLKNKEPYFH